MSAQIKISKEQALFELWRRGNLRWKLHKGQKELYDLYYNGNLRQMTWLLARRSGKTYCLALLAIEQCLRNPNSIVKFLAPTKTQLDTNLRPIFKKILTDCPSDLSPTYVARQYIYYFKNGSEIQLAGTDNGHAEKLRGGDSHIWIIDEAGSCDNLDDIIKGILIPTTLTTKGKGLIASTPPKDPEHDFVKILERAELNNSLVKKTVLDNPMVTQQDINDMIADLGGIDSDSCQRELFCKIIKDSNVFVVPEFTEELQSEVVRDWPRPPFFDCYVGMDLGGKDLTVCLFGYYDFRSNKIVIEDEIVMDFRKHGNHLRKLTQEIHDKEENLYTNVYTNEIKKPTIRVSDIDYIVTNEIYSLSEGKISFQPAKKDNNDTAINDLRQLIAAKKIIINPRCVNLISHLKNVKWAKNRKTFARSSDDLPHHYDAVDALKYLVRHVNLHKNPYPAHYDFNMRDIYIPDKNKFNQSRQTNPAIAKKDPVQQYQQLEVYRTIFGLRQKKEIKND
jgi:hypothetical protein